MPRFFVSPKSISGSRVSLEGGAASQITRVLRGRPGDNVIVLDGSGLEYRVVLRSVSTEQVIGDVVESGLCEGEPGIEITLYQAIIKGDKFEYVLQKGTELGVSSRGRWRGTTVSGRLWVESRIRARLRTASAYLSGRRAG
jgi:16S rRNA (uracil1498-N3)-methyltransferase